MYAASQSDFEIPACRTYTTPTCELSLARCASTSPPDQSTSRIADRYHLLGCLGRGGMGEVMLADDLLLGRPVAIKRSRTREHDGPYGRKLRREARIAASVTHRAIVQVFDVAHDDGTDHLVMELVAGSSLQRLVGRGPVDPAEVVSIAMELAGALALVHARGVVHLDVKLENVLMGLDGQPKLTDFGIARCAHEPDLLSEELVGTPRIMSPEQIRGGAIDARSDLYSLGVLMFELLVARSPFSSETDLHTLARVLEQRAPRVDEVVPDVPRDLASLIAQLLEKDPLLRPQRATEVQMRLLGIATAIE